MAQHKAPTAVTLAPTRESSGVARFVERYWKVAALVAVVFTGIALWREYSRSSKRQAHDSSWENLMALVTEDRMLGQLTGSPTELQELARRQPDTHAAPWALYIAATSAIHERRYEDAQAILAQLRSSHPDHLLVKDTFTIEGEAGSLSVVDRLDQRIALQRSWVAAHPTLFENPASPADAPRVRIKTDRGDLVVALYPDLAPKHVENFLKLVREGYYSGTKFHRVVAGSLIEGGDPNSKEGDPATWGQGGPEYTIEKEENTLKHFPGVLSAAKSPGGEQSSGSQFVITTAEAHFLDDQNVVFGRVLEGMEVVREIERGGVVPNTARPQDPVSIQATEVL